MPFVLIFVNVKVVKIIIFTNGILKMKKWINLKTHKKIQRKVFYLKIILDLQLE